ncbi:MAG: Gfo/Idh/MocA family oxidoreductase [Haliea sp.]|nr:MAG: Gfo/Idh/MocA family oxidoreductase [Haliea sp.]
MQNPGAKAPLRVLLTGAGSIGRRHAENVRRLVPDARISCVCRSDASKTWAEAFGAQPLPSVEAALDSLVQLVVVCSASSSHARDLELLMPVAQALYVEKPVVTTAAALQALERALDAGWNKPSVVGCNLRYLGAVGKLKQALDQEAAGRCVHSSLRVGQWLPGWRPQRDWRDGYSAHRSQGGGVIFDLVHELDSAILLFGEIERGQAAAGSLSSLGLDADDTAAITLLMRSGLPVQVLLDYVSRVPVREYVVTGDEATLNLDVIGRQLSVTGTGGRQALPTTDADWDMAGTYVAAMSELLGAMEGDGATRYGLRDALPTARWMLQLESTAWRGRPVAGAKLAP